MVSRWRDRYCKQTLFTSRYFCQHVVTKLRMFLTIWSTNINQLKYVVGSQYYVFLLRNMCLPYFFSHRHTFYIKMTLTGSVKCPHLFMLSHTPRRHKIRQSCFYSAILDPTDKNRNIQWIKNPRMANATHPCHCHHYMRILSYVLSTFEQTRDYKNVLR